MKSYFRHRPLNPPFEDPCLVIGIVRQKRILLFDIGDIHRLSERELLKVSDLFVTHMHIDHFIGLDTLLRAILRRPSPLRIFGPEGLIECVEGRLRGYTWNLINTYPLRIEVYEIKDKELRHCSFYAEEGLKPLMRESIPFNGLLLSEPFFTVKALCLSHGIPVISYRIDEEIHINIDKDLLLKKGLTVGPWLSEFKEALIKGDLQRRLLVGKGFVTAEEVRDIAIITEGEKISYVMDLSPEKENIERVIEFVRGSDYLYCEAYFIDKDIHLARERNHLTARLAGEIARKAGVKNIIPLHFSLRYKHMPSVVIDEVKEAFSGQEEK